MKNVLICGVLLASAAIYCADPADQPKNFLRIDVEYNGRLTEQIVMPVKNRETLTRSEVKEWLKAYYKGTRFYIENFSFGGLDWPEFVRFNTPPGVFHESGIYVHIKSHK